MIVRFLLLGIFLLSLSCQSSQGTVASNLGAQTVVSDESSGSTAFQPGSPEAQPGSPEAQEPSMLQPELPETQPGPPSAGSSSDLPNYPQAPDVYEILPVSSFREIWGYVLTEREHELKADYPLSDIG
jgi:hypothetical protein